MALLNIGASNRDDAFYRYKMPRMVTKIEGRGNGIKTNIVNMVDIAKALGRPASYTTKFFGCELGAQSKFDEKTGTSLVNGAHDTAKLANLLENFIKKYVQCYGCGNPETEVVISKTQKIHLKCAACGFVSEVDMREKLTTFILKNPPEQKGSKDKKAMRRAEKERLKEGEAADEKMRKLKKEAKKKGASNGTKETSSKGTKKKNAASDEDQSPTLSAADETEKLGSDDDDVQWQTDTSREAAEQRMKEQLSAATAEMVMLSTEEEKKPSRKAPESKNNGYANSNGNAKEVNCAVPAQNVLVKNIKAELEKGLSASKLATVLDSYSGTRQEVMNALFVSLFDGAGKGFAKQVVQKKNYLAAVTQEDGSQVLLLNALEAFCEKANHVVVKDVALVLKALYDHDLLEEEFVMAWYKKGSVGSGKDLPIWKNAKPFVEWLESAESEDDE